MDGDEATVTVHFLCREEARQVGGDEGRKDTVLVIVTVDIM